MNEPRGDGRQATDRPETVFVVGTGRTGSTALSRILNTHPEVLSLNEYLVSLGGDRVFPAGEVSGARFWELLSEPHPAFDEMARQGWAPAEILYGPGSGRFSADSGGVPRLCLMVLPHLTDDPDGLFDELGHEVRAWPARPAADQHTALFRTLAERFGRRVVVERSGASLGRVPLLRRAFPEARFVHMYRNGPDCALSMGHHVGFRAAAMVREVLERTGADALADITDDHLVRLPDDLAAWVSQGFPAELTMALRPSPARFGMLWSEMITEGLGHLSEVPADRRMALSYDDLIDDPEAELDRLSRFTGLARGPAWSAAWELLDSGRRGASLRLPPEELAELREGCAPGEKALAGP
ncbi:sulfotransferase family protein [Nocardiopsis halophila]|uniref:sulfotransferase family protein n=1 Tax=Nocardiopsis halophila TaxID=141692 RepID=UPI0003495DD6|nr:sulfotransferase [Nocardiopsis halophila]